MNNTTTASTWLLEQMRREDEQTRGDDLAAQAEDEYRATLKAAEATPIPRHTPQEFKQALVVKKRAIKEGRHHDIKLARCIELVREAKRQKQQEAA